METRCIILAAGGTGGHMFPAQALASELRRRDWRTALITDARGLALAKDFPANPIELVEAATVNPRSPFKAIIGAGRIAQGTNKARKLIRSLKPDAVVGFGGYPSFPALGAALGQAPIVLHEQNAVLGRVNRVFARRAAALASGFSRLERMPPAAAENWVITGNPVRTPVLDARMTSYLPPDDDGEIHLFVIGGSLGARVLSEITPRAVAKLPEALRKRLSVVQQTREDLLEHARSIYKEAGVKAECKPFFDDVAQRYARAHLVIGRAGASSVTEIAVIGRPSILVPLKIAMDNHQTLNAQALVEAGGAEMILEPEFDGQSLSALLTKLFNNPQDLARRAASARTTGRPDATSALADLVEQIATGTRVAA